MRRLPLPPADPEPVSYETGRRSPTRNMLTVLATLAVAVLIWPVLLHPAKRTGAKPATTVPRAHAAAPTMTPVPLRSTTAGAWLPTESAWGEQLRSGDYWARHAFGGSNWNQPRNGLTRSDRVSIPWPEIRGQPEGWDWQGTDRGGGKTYRTMCVRLCDGFYWPVSYAVTKDRLEADADTCSRSCGGPDHARLFIYRNPGSEIDAMEDLDGQAYKKLKTAFLFKTKYEASCKCRPDPWDQASADRHKSYALAEQAQRGNKAAAVQLQELRTKIRSDEKASAKSKAAQSKSAKSAAAALAKKEAKPDTDEAPYAQKATIAASVARPHVTRGADKHGGHIRSPPRPAVEVVDDDDDAQTSAVRMRFGNRPPVDVRVRPAGRPRKAAEAAGTRVVKQ